MRVRAALALLAALAFAMGLAACGGGGGTSTPTVVPTPVPTPATTTIATGTFVGLGVNEATFRDFASPAAGRVRAQANWTFTTNDVDVFVVSGNSCTLTDLVNNRCTVLCSDVRVGGSSASCELNATSGNARLFLINFGPGGESGTYLVTVTN